MKKIYVTSSCLIRGQHYDVGQIVEGDEKLLKEFLFLDRGRTATEDEIAVAKKAKRENAAATIESEKR